MKTGRNLALLAVALAPLAATAGLRFDPPVNYPHQEPNLMVILGDVDGDGDVDVVHVNASVGISFESLVWLNTGDGTLQAPIVFPFWESSRGLALKDLNGDGRSDFVAPTSVGTVRIFLSQGDGTFDGPVEYPLSALAGVDVDVVDINNDGKQDLLLGMNTRDVAVFLGNGDGTFRAQANVPVARGGGQLTANDFNGDGNVDFFCGYEEGAAIYSFAKGRGNGTFDVPTSLPSAKPFFPTTSMAGADLNADGLQDILLGHGSELGVLLGTGPGTWGAESLLTTSNFGGGLTDMAVADFDQDGKLDVFYHMGDTQFENRLRLGNGDGTFGPVAMSWRTGAGSEYQHMLAAGDMNGDGTPDLVYQARKDLFGETQLVVVLNRSGNLPPVANAGADQVIECSSPAGTPVQLDGSASTDPDTTTAQNDIASYEWFADFGGPAQALLATGVSPSVVLANGEHTLTLVVTDRAAAQGTDSVLVSVRDTTPPKLTLTVSPESLWPPNHRLVPVRVAFDVVEICDARPRIELVAARSSEPDDAPGEGDGHTTADIRGADLGSADTLVLLRAERQGSGPGRHYSLEFRVVDESGNESRVIAVVEVPHDRSRKRPASKRVKGEVLP